MSNYENYDEFFNDFSNAEQKEKGTKGAIIVPELKKFSDFIIWKSFESEVQKLVPNALKSGLNCCVIIIAGEDASFVCNSLQPYLEGISTVKFISGHAESTMISHFRRSNNKKLQQTQIEEFLRKYQSRKRFFIVTSSISDIPAEIKAMADGVVDLTAIDEYIVAEGITRFIEKDAEMNLPDLMSAANSGFQTIALAFKSGRELSKSFEICENMRQKQLNQKVGASDGPCLDDLHGLGAAGEWGRDLAQDIQEWQLGFINWAEIDKGVLISGAPGTGKTTFAAALARTCNINFVSSSIAQWQSHGHLGDMLREMRATFQDAMDKSPCILFIDEFDSVGDRAEFDGQNKHYNTEVVNALLECIDGSSKMEGVVVVAASNFPEKIDAALKRAGRLDRHIVIPLPDADARIGILKFHLNGALDDHDLSQISEELEGASGADIEQLVRQAKRFSRRHKRELQLVDLCAALPPKRILSQKTLERLAIHEAGHAVIGHEYGYPVLEIKIAKSVPVNVDNFAGGYIEFGAHPADFMSVQKDINEYTQRLLGGMAAEKEIFGEHSTGVASDLQYATYHVASMLMAAGMGDDLLCLTDMNRDTVLAALRMRKDLQDKVSNTLNECLKSAENIIQNRRNHVEKLAEALIEKGRLSGAEVREIFAINERIHHEFDSEVEQQNNVRYLH